MDQTGNEARDAYSEIVIGVAEQLTPRVAALRVRRSDAGRQPCAPFGAWLSCTNRFPVSTSGSTAL